MTPDPDRTEATRDRTRRRRAGRARPGDARRTGPCRRSGSMPRPGATASRRPGPVGVAGCPASPRRCRPPIVVDGRRRVRRGLAERAPFGPDRRGIADARAAPPRPRGDRPPRPHRRSSSTVRCRIRPRSWCKAAEPTRLADLATGVLGPRVFGAYSGPTAVVARPGGGWLCVCSDWAGSGPSGPARIIVKLAIAGPTGQLETETLVRDIDGRADPGCPVAAQTQVVDAHASVSPTADSPSWAGAVREGADGWKLGIDVIDVAAGRVVGSSELPALPSATADGQPTTRIAPEIDVAASGGSGARVGLLVRQRGPGSTAVGHRPLVGVVRRHDRGGLRRRPARHRVTPASCVATGRRRRVHVVGPVLDGRSVAVRSHRSRRRDDRFDGSAACPTVCRRRSSTAGASTLYVWGPVARTLARDRHRDRARSRA